LPASRPKSVFERWRKSISRALAVLIIAFLILSDPSHMAWLNLPLKIAGVLFIGAAVLGRIWCALYIAGRKNTDLCSDGPYSLCRNPLYFFSFFGAIGFAFVAGSLSVGMALVPLFWCYHHFVIKNEEARLSALFGAAYETYRATVPRIIPRPNLYWSRPCLTVDPHVMLRAISEVAWFLIALALSEMIEPLQRTAKRYLAELFI
jgi:protein-S-isoprenylcysteine O-methyltransferase Ste14